MEEFRFWAIPYSFKQLFLLAIPIWIVFFAVIYFIDAEKYFFYLWLGMLGWVLVSYALIVKRVRISFSEEGDVSVFMNGQKKYEGKGRQLEYVRSTNLNNSIGRTSMTIKFSGKKFRFSIFEISGIMTPRENQQIRLLRYMISTYNLRAELYQDNLLNRIYTYWNADYEGIPSTHDCNKNKI